MATAGTLALGLHARAWGQAPNPTPMSPTARGQIEMMEMTHRGVHNQLGILEYCQSRGSVGADAVALQRRMIDLLPPLTVSGLDEAEAAGKRGVRQVAGLDMPLDRTARTENTTPDAICRQLAAALQNQMAGLAK